MEWLWQKWGLHLTVVLVKYLLPRVHERVKTTEEGKIQNEV
jgi:hypothetical protein